jgi:hypothetical protein
VAGPFALYRRNGLSVLTDMKIKIPFLLFATAAFALAQQGTAEKALDKTGKGIDNTVRGTKTAAKATEKGTVKAATATGHGARKAGEATNDAAHATGSGIKKAAGATKSGTKKAVHATGKGLEKTGKALDGDK